MSSSAGGDCSLTAGGAICTPGGSLAERQCRCCGPRQLAMDVSTGVNACNTFGLRRLEDSEGISFEAEPGVHQRVLDFSGVTAAHTFESLLNQILAELSRDRNTFEAALVDMTSTLRSEVELLSKELGEQTSRHTASIHEVKHMFTEGSRMLEAQFGGILAQVAEEQAAREEMESMMRMASS